MADNTDLYPFGPRRRRLLITAKGRALYEREWTRYREMYPDVEAPEPSAARTPNRMNGAVLRTCELCGSTVDVKRRWIDTRDQLPVGGWTEGLLCAECGSRQEGPPDFIGDPETFAPLEPAEPTQDAPANQPEVDTAAQSNFKILTLENWQQPDPVAGGYVTLTPEGQARQMTGDDWAGHILRIQLDISVPIELRRLFMVARGTMLYGWFFYPAYTLASEQVLRIAEAAVGRRCQDLDAPRLRTFQHKLAWLGERGLLSADELVRWDAVRHLRNFVSHPSDQNILPPGMVISQVQLLAEAIGALFQHQLDEQLDDSEKTMGVEQK